MISTIQIDGKHKQVTQLTQNNPRSLREYKERAKDSLIATYLPVDYPDSVTPNYLPFATMSALGAISFTAMHFLSTQSLFVALGGSSS